MVKGIFFVNYRHRKIIKIEVHGEFFTVHFNDGEILTDLSITELNHVVVTATGR